MNVETTSDNKVPNVLSQSNHKLWVKYLTEAEKIKKKVEKEITASKNITDQYNKEEKPGMQERTVLLRQNQLFMLNDALDRLMETKCQIKSI